MQAGVVFAGQFYGKRRRFVAGFGRAYKGVKLHSDVSAVIAFVVVQVVLYDSFVLAMCGNQRGRLLKNAVQGFDIVHQHIAGG